MSHGFNVWNAILAEHTHTGKTDNRMMAKPPVVTVVNLGAVSRIPAENLPPASTHAYVEDALFKILVLGANTLEIGEVVGKIRS